MSEEKKQELLDEISEALAEVPEKYRKDVVQSLTHDISVTARAIRIMKGKSA